MLEKALEKRWNKALLVSQHNDEHDFNLSAPLKKWIEQWQSMRLGYRREHHTCKAQIKVRRSPVRNLSDKAAASMIESNLYFGVGSGEDLLSTLSLSAVLISPKPLRVVSYMLELIQCSTNARMPEYCSDCSNVVPVSVGRRMKRWLPVESPGTPSKRPS